MSSRDPFKWLSDLQQGDKKVTLNHLVSKLTWSPLARSHLCDAFFWGGYSPETERMSPENQCLEDAVFPIEIVPF